jgi:hypothetical protein
MPKFSSQLCHEELVDLLYKGLNDALLVRRRNRRDWVGDALIGRSHIRAFVTNVCVRWQCQSHGVIN